MKYLFLVLLLIACNKKPEEPKTTIPVVEEIKLEFEVDKCYRTRSAYIDYYFRVDKKYDENTLNVTIIKRLEYYTEIATIDRTEAMEYSCEAFQDMMKTSYAYKEPVEQCEECNCDKEN
jgi:hypothetical protein